MTRPTKKPETTPIALGFVSPQHHAEVSGWKERAEKAEALVAAYRTVLGGMRDLTLGLSRMIDEGLATAAGGEK